MHAYKLENYNSLFIYLIVDEPQRLSEQLSKIFSAPELRRFEDKGRIQHLELKIDDTVLMMSSSVEGFPAQKVTLHCYVPDVFETFKKAVEAGCEKIEEPYQREGDADIRGSFYDCAGNWWSIEMQNI